MNVIRRFTLRSMLMNKKRTAVTIVGVLISAAMITAVAALISSFVGMVQRDAIAENGNWHAELLEVSADRIDSVTQDDAVKSACLSRDLGYALLAGARNARKPYLCLREYSPSGFSQMSVRLVSGRLPASSGEIALSESIAKSGGLAYSIGDTLTLTLGQRIGIAGDPLSYNSFFETGETEDGDALQETFLPEKEQSFTVVGIIEAPSFEQSWSAGYGAVSYLNEAALTSRDKVDIFVEMKAIDQGIFDNISWLAEKAGLGRDGAVTNSELLRYYGVVQDDNVLAFLRGFETVLMAIILISSISLIYNAFAISVSERSKQLGLLASIGATRLQKRRSVYFEALLIGVIGIPLGILAGIGGIAVTLAAIQPLLDTFLTVSEGIRLTLSVPPAAVILAVFSSSLTILLSAYRPAVRASRIMPIDAIRQAEDIHLTGRAVKSPRFIRKLFGFEAEIALKNLRRSRKKYRATVVSLVVSLVLFLSVASYAGLTRAVSGATFSGFNYDISLVYQDVDGSTRENMSKNIESLALVNGYAEVSSIRGYAPLTADKLSEYAKLFNQPDVAGEYGFSLDIVALDSQSFTAYVKAVGANERDYTDVQNPCAILINEGLSNYSQNGVSKKVSGGILNIKAGDSLSFLAGSPVDRTGSEEGQKITVGAVTGERPMGTLMQSFQTATLVVSQDTFEAMAAGLSKGQRQEIGNTLFLSTNDDQQLESQISSLTEGISQGIFVRNIKSAARSEQSLMTFLGVFVYGFITLISLICVANIFNTVSTNISLRRKEFAMLRSVGMTPKGFNRMLRFESVFYGLKCLLYGLPLSVLVSLFLYRLEKGVLDTPFVLPWASYGFAVFMILGIVFVTMMYSTHKIKKENIIDALKEENI